MSTQPSFLSSLFDFSFTTFVTLRLVKFLYALSIVFLALVVLGVIVAGFTEAVSGVETIGYLVLAPVIGFVYLLLVRLWLELIVVVFRIAETASEVRELLSAEAISESPSPEPK